MTGGSSSQGKPELESRGTRWITFGVILAIHVLIIGGLLLWGCTSTDKPKKPKEKHYKVNLSGQPPMPEPPADPPPPSPETPPPETPVAEPPKPVPPQPPVVEPPPPQPEVRPKPPKKKITPKPVPQQPRVKRRPPKPVPQQPKVKRRPPKPVPQPPKVVKMPRKPTDSGVYNPKSESKFDPKKKYSYNSNSRSSTSSPRSSNNQSARPGPPSDSKADEKWQESVAGDLHGKWIPPENVFTRNGNPPQAVVELTIAADGRVLKTRLVTPSGNARMDATIREMLNNLRSVPRPPEGGRTIRVMLIPE